MGLVIQRKVGQSVVIGDDIEVIVTEIKESHVVKLTVECPKDIKVWRKELAQEILAHQAKDSE